MRKLKKLTIDITDNHVKKDTLVIIGNGFDRWQGLDTSYSAFRKYYLQHRDEIMKKLRIKKRKVIYSTDHIEEFSDVELVYGDPFQPNELDEIFWGDFESSLNKIDDQKLNLFFGKEQSELKEMSRSIRNAKKILTTAFCDWIASLEINQQNQEYKFGDNCVFINFNYTDTLVKRFGIKPCMIHHIHGESSDKSSIVFGHSSHPQYPLPQLYDFGGRFRGAFFVDCLLYETDKHVQDNIQELIMFLTLQAVIPDNIKHIYVLGHSMNPVDVEYFQFLIDMTSVKSNVEKDAPTQDNFDPMEDFKSQIDYIVSHRNRTFYGEMPSEQQINAIRKRFLTEQEERDKLIEKLFFKKIGIKAENSKSQSSNAYINNRLEDAKWHISCYSNKDKQWVDIVMKELGCKNYVTYKTIDECIEHFRIV